MAVGVGTAIAWVLHFTVDEDSPLHFSPQRVFEHTLLKHHSPSLPIATFDRIVDGFKTAHLLGKSSVILSIAIVGTVSNLAMLDLAAMLGDRYVSPLHVCP